jgi:hypothetical protein
MLTLEEYIVTVPFELPFILEQDKVEIAIEKLEAILEYCPEEKRYRLVSVNNGLPLSSGYRFKDLSDFKAWVEYTINSSFRAFGKSTYIKRIAINGQDIDLSIQRFKL